MQAYAQADARPTKPPCISISASKMIRRWAAVPATNTAANLLIRRRWSCKSWRQNPAKAIALTSLAKSYPRHVSGRFGQHWYARYNLGACPSGCSPITDRWTPRHPKHVATARTCGTTNARPLRSVCHDGLAKRLRRLVAHSTDHLGLLSLAALALTASLLDPGVTIEAARGLGGGGGESRDRLE